MQPAREPWEELTTGELKLLRQYVDKDFSHLTIAELRFLLTEQLFGGVMFYVARTSGPRIRYALRDRLNLKLDAQRQAGHLARGGDREDVESTLADD